MTEADLKQHRIEYWLNQIELWFRILMRRLLNLARDLASFGQ
jgi:hypothetical protein